MASKLYGSIKYLSDIPGCTIEPVSAVTSPSVSAVDLPTLVSWAKTRALLTAAINGGAEIDYILVSLASVSGNYRCDISPTMKGGGAKGARFYSNSDPAALASEVFSNTGITIYTNITPPMASKIVPTTVIYEYKSKQISKLYGSVNGQTKEIKKLYGSVNGQTKLVYQAQ